MDAPGALHHVMGRGIEKKKIFWNNKDRDDFIERLAALVEKGAMDIYGWTLIPNHFHMLLRTGNRPLSQSMRKLLTGYVVNFNKRHKRHGHLFQNRYKSIVCQEDAYLKELVRYIHLNPLRAGMVKDVKELNCWPWCGHSALMGKVDRKWQDRKYVLSFFGAPSNARRNYVRYVQRGVGQGQRPELVGGGLIRSLGGWSEVLALRKRGEKQASDTRILGDSEFVEEVTSDLDELVKKNLRLSRRQVDMVTLARRVCKKHGISVKELRSGSRRREIVEARGIISWIGVRELGYSGADLARYLGVTNSCVTRSVLSVKKPNVKEYVNHIKR